MLDQEAPHAEGDAIARIGGDPALPQWLGDDTEHRTAIEALPTGLQGVDPPVTELAGFMEGSGSGHGLKAER